MELTQEQIDLIAPLSGGELDSVIKMVKLQNAQKAVTKAIQDRDAAIDAIKDQYNPVIDAANEAVEAANNELNGG